jgi:prephenate dehydrogenase
VVLGCDLDKASEVTAVERFCVDRIGTFEEVSDCDVVFLAVPPDSVVEVGAAAVELNKREGVITDCAGVKGGVAAWAEAQKLPRFVPGHPMAGHEKSGSKFASAWLFKGARWLLTPTRSTRASATRVVKQLVKEMGATPVEQNPEEHDRHVAVLSHLPHVLAAALVTAGDTLPSWEIAGGSWRDMTRVGGVDPDLWAQIFLGNRAELGHSVEELIKILSEFLAKLEGGDMAEVHSWLGHARSIKETRSATVVTSPGIPRQKPGKRRKI